MRVLLVEDEPDLVTFVVLVLTQAGHTVTVSTDGDLTGMDVDVDVALVDMMLPGTDGNRVLEVLRDRAPGCRVLAFTAAPESLDTSRFDGLVRKPWGTVKELVDAVEGRQDG